MIGNVTSGSYAGVGAAAIGYYSICMMSGYFSNTASSNYLYASVQQTSATDAAGKSNWSIYVSSTSGGLPVFYTCFDT